MYPSFRAQSDKLQHETRRAHQVKKKNVYIQITKTTKSQTKSFSLTLCNLKGFFKMRVLLIFLGFFSLNVNQQLLNANIAIPLNSPCGFVLWIINHQFTIIDENFKILKPRVPQRRF